MPERLPAAASAEEMARGLDFREIFGVLLGALPPDGTLLPGAVDALEASPDADVDVQQQAGAARFAADAATLLPGQVLPPAQVMPAGQVDMEQGVSAPMVDLGAMLPVTVQAGVQATGHDGDEAANFASPGAFLPVSDDDLPVRQGFADPGMIQNTAVDGQAAVPMASGQVVHQAAATAEARPATSVATHVAPHISHAEWNDAFSQKVVWMAGQQHQQADIQINPPNLGPVEVRLSLNQDQASLMFISPHAAVRDAIQSALPRLQDMMASSGLTLGNVFVGSEAAQQQAYGERQARHGGAGGELAGEVVGMGGVSGELYLPRHHGMVDLFA